MRIINRQQDMMDENSLNGAQQNVGVGQNRVNNNNAATGDKADDANNGNAQIPQYTIPGILHFIEHEWQRFQAERSQWDTDRAELQVSVVSFAWLIDKCYFVKNEMKERKKLHSGAKHFFLLHYSACLLLFIHSSPPLTLHSFKYISHTYISVFHDQRP